MTIPVLQWTPPAQGGLERYFAARLAPDQLDGADAEELRGDLQAHLEEELTQRGVTTVTLEDLRQALAKMGEVLPAAVIPPVPVPVRRSEVPGQPFAKPGAWRWIRLAAFFFPLLVVAFEIITRGCAGMLFDPMPDLFHHLLVLVVPASAWLFLKSRGPGLPPRLLACLPWSIGAALAVTFYYGICFLPVSPAAVPTIIWFGVGLLALSPFFALTAVRQAWNALVRGDGLPARRKLRQGFWGMALLILLMGLPALVTRLGIFRAERAGMDEAERASAIQMIRQWGSEDALIRACYSRPFRFQMGRALNEGPIAWMAEWVRRPGNGNGVEAELFASTSRELYYRVTGRTFSSVPRPATADPWIYTIFNPKRNAGSDNDRGGTQVAGQISGLSLAEGRMDWHCEQASGLTWGEWTLTFDNRTENPEEARCRIALPPGGFVSRVTLWVNGQPEEAAYSTVSKVRAAYQSVAVVQRRDPVLVTQPEAGSILVQAFPVPARGQLKTRITFTVPAGADHRVWLPSLVEQNFELSPAARHALWIQADGGTLALSDELNPHTALEAGRPTVTASLAPQSLTGSGACFTWMHQPAAVVYSEDRFAAPDARVVVRNHAPPVTTQPAAVAWVVDTSASLAPHREAIRSALGTFAQIPAMLFLPGDTAAGLQTLTDPRTASLTFAGGRDNTPALAAAMEWLRGKPDGCLIWLHGPQPVSSASRLTLEQLMERSVSRFTLLDVPLVHGENTLAALFGGLSRITTLPVRHAGHDLAASLRGAFLQRGGSFTTQAEGTVPPDGALQTSDSLARWFARTEASRLGLTDPAAASALAAAHQIVSPWSGAVVLERADDYAKHGLQQSSASVSQQIPAIPEPSGVLLMMLSAIPFLLRRRRACLCAR